MILIVLLENFFVERDCRITFILLGGDCLISDEFGCYEEELRDD